MTSSPAEFDRDVQKTFDVFVQKIERLQMFVIFITLFIFGSLILLIAYVVLRCLMARRKTTSKDALVITLHDLESHGEKKKRKEMEKVKEIQDKKENEQFRREEREAKKRKQPPPVKCDHPPVVHRPSDDIFFEVNINADRSLRGDNKSNSFETITESSEANSTHTFDLDEPRKLNLSDLSKQESVKKETMAKEAPNNTDTNKKVAATVPSTETATNGSPWKSTTTARSYSGSSDANSTHTFLLAHAAKEAAASQMSKNSELSGSHDTLTGSSEACSTHTYDLDQPRKIESVPTKAGPTTGQNSKKEKDEPNKNVTSISEKSVSKASEKTSINKDCQNDPKKEAK